MKPDLRDVHVYGGVALAGIAGEVVCTGLGLFLVGAALFYIGLFRGGK